jgi:uncharacterized protein YegL
MRRLPIFLLVDVSESMAGENLRQMQEGLERLMRSLRADPYALETAYISVIAFAGKAKTLTPLVELYQFYPPRLPLGSGTSLGGAMNHLMNEMELTVQRSSAEKKGDWRPVVYLLTDGKPTDDIEPAIKRWKRDFEHRSNLVAIGIGKHASHIALQRFTENVLSLDATTEDDFKRFIDWISQSVASQSRSVSMNQDVKISLTKVDDSIMEKIAAISRATTVDEDFVVIVGKCQSSKLPYLMKFERTAQQISTREIQVSADRYNLVGVFAAEKDYYELSDPRAMARTISTDALIGAPGCPHCGNPYGLAVCSCGQVFCVSGLGEATCPGCNKAVTMGQGDGEGFDISRARG